MERQRYRYVIQMAASGSRPAPWWGTMEMQLKCIYRSWSERPISLQYQVHPC